MIVSQPWPHEPETIYNLIIHYQRNYMLYNQFDGCFQCYLILWLYTSESYMIGLTMFYSCEILTL